MKLWIFKDLYNEESEKRFIEENEYFFHELAIMKKNLRIAFINGFCSVFLIVHKLSEWVYHTDGKRAFCLTCGDEAMARKTNDFTRIGTFEIISSYYYVLIKRYLRQNRRQFNKLRVTLKERKQISRNCVRRKKWSYLQLHKFIWTTMLTIH